MKEKNTTPSERFQKFRNKGKIDTPNHRDLNRFHRGHAAYILQAHVPLTQICIITHLSGASIKSVGVVVKLQFSFMGKYLTSQQWNDEVMQVFSTCE